MRVRSRRPISSVSHAGSRSEAQRRRSVEGRIGAPGWPHEGIINDVLVAKCNVHSYGVSASAIFGAYLLTARPSQIEVVTLAVYLLGGDQRPIDTEDVAVK